MYSFALWLLNELNVFILILGITLILYGELNLCPWSFFFFSSQFLFSFGFCIYLDSDYNDNIIDLYILVFCYYHDFHIFKLFCVTLSHCEFVTYVIFMYINIFFYHFICSPTKLFFSLSLSLSSSLFFCLNTVLFFYSEFNYDILYVCYTYSSLL